MALARTIWTKVLSVNGFEPNDDARVLTWVDRPNLAASSATHWVLVSPDRELPTREELLGVDLARQPEQHRLHEVASLVGHAELGEPLLEPRGGGLVHGDERGLGRPLDL